MKLSSFLLSSRGPVNLAKRLPTIAQRFGITEAKIERCLHSFIDISDEFNTKPTLAITANLLDRYPDLVRRLYKRGVEFAIHGLVHTDYSELSLEKHLNHIRQAMQIFERHSVDFVGFRCPYLRSNPFTLEAVRELGFLWESSDVIAWDVVRPAMLGGNHGLAYKKLLALYSAKDSKSNFSVPRLLDGIIEIPVSIPDDEAIIDRLGLEKISDITRLWASILDHSYHRGDIFTIQLHHERVPFLAPALKSVLETASKLSPSVWIASLKEVADWHMKRSTFTFDLADLGGGRYGVHVRADSDATVLIKNVRTDRATNDWHDGYQAVTGQSFTIHSDKPPIIGIGSGLDKSIANAVSNEGFIVRNVSGPSECAVYLDGALDEVSLVKHIENSGAPLLRFWRWPRASRSAISLTGDIDSITIIDFAKRMFEVRNVEVA